MGLQSSRNSEYVDKSGLIAVVNKTLFTRQRFTCVSRCRRFGKSMAAEMLCAYYDKSCDSRSLFADLKIANDPSFEKHLNKYPVICLDVASFVAGFRDGDVVGEMDAALLKDLQKAYPSIQTEEKDSLMDMLMRTADETGDRFIFIIDEWDAICREYPSESPMMRKYVDWLRKLFKSLQAINVFAGVYMTGILPIKKYQTQSALNRSAQGDACLSKNFEEYSVIEPGDMASFFGFTMSEVRTLAGKSGIDFDELIKWYDGYMIGDEPSMFNPNSVMSAIRRRRCIGYWNKTAAYDAIVPYITMNFDGLKDDIIFMLAGGRCFVDPTGFQNDLAVVNSKDDVLTVLIHLGYLSYDGATGECFVPCEAVARGIEAVHDENTSILSYNDENSLACVISLAYYYAKNDYIVHREYASGKGFADLVLIPRKNVESPAIVVELKCDKDADTAISQIKRKQYPDKVAPYCDNILLVGINYDRKSKTHTCLIEKHTA